VKVKFIVLPQIICMEVFQNRSPFDVFVKMITVAKDAKPNSSFCIHTFSRPLYWPCDDALRLDKGERTHD